MAASRQSLASELLQRIKKTGYNVVVPYLDCKTALNLRDIRRLKRIMRQSGKEVDTDKFYTCKGNPKPNAIFEVFGQYCGEMMVDYVHHNRKTVQAEFQNALEAKRKDLPWWTVKQTSSKTPGDELTIYLLSKMFDRHSLIYTLKEPWCTFVHKVSDELSVLLSKSDLVFVYTQYRFGQITDLPDKATKVGKQVQRRPTKKGNPANKKTEKWKRCNTNSNEKGSKKTNPETTPSSLPMEQTERQIEACSNPINGRSSSMPNRSGTKHARVTTSVNEMSATLSANNIIESKRPHNTRGRSSTRKRVNPRDERLKKHIDYSIYYSSRDSESETSPSPKKSCSVAENSLREPTPARLKSQTIITRQRLQELSPDSSRVRLIGTVTSPRPLIIKPKIKKEPIVKCEKSAEIADYLSKGLCLSAHTDRSACANIQNPNNINVKPMGIREHRKKQ